MSGGLHDRGRLFEATHHDQGLVAVRHGPGALASNRVVAQADFQLLRRVLPVSFRAF